jgi:hypothetical protein
MILTLFLGMPERCMRGMLLVHRIDRECSHNNPATILEEPSDNTLLAIPARHTWDWIHKWLQMNVRYNILMSNCHL